MPGLTDADIWKSLDVRLAKYTRQEGECLLWTGARGAAGYARLSYCHRVYPVGRLVWERAHGPLPKGLCILHRCDNPACVRLEHLFSGTHGDNVRDCIQKGRFRPGSFPGAKNNNAVLTEERVKAVRRAYSEGASIEALASICGMSMSAIVKIVRRASWKHV